MGETQRLFLAVFPPPETQAAVAAAADALRAAAPHMPVSWVRRENLHFTLRFLGDCDPAQAGRAEAALTEAAAGAGAFDAALGGHGAFPSPRHARVLWLGMEAGEGALRSLAGSLEAALAARGFGPADKPFAPHLTLGRVRQGGDWSEVLAAVPPVLLPFRVREAALVRSTLGPGGPEYQPSLVVSL
jgi:2'-5' RNA ligase